MLLPILVSLLVVVCAGDRSQLSKFCSNQCVDCLVITRMSADKPSHEESKRADALDGLALVPAAKYVLQRYPGYVGAIQRNGDKYELEK